MPPPQKSINRQDCVSTFVFQCCSDDCVRWFSLDEIISAQSSYKAKNRDEKRKWLYTIFQHSSDNHHVNQKPCCKEGFRLIYDICKDFYYGIKHLVDDHHSLSDPLHPHKNSTKSDMCHAWFSSYIQKVGDLMPDSPNIHIPRYIRWKDMYAVMISEMADQWTEKMTPKYATFFRCVRTQFPHVKRPRFTRLGKCDTCTRLSQNIQSATSDDQKDLLRKERKDHTKLTQAERRSYHQRRFLGRENPREHLSIIIDASSGIHLPHISPIPKGFSYNDRLKLTIFGVIDHSHSLKKLYCLLPVWNLGPNLTITILMHHLYDLKQKSLASQNLLLQMDNSAKDNKNKYVIGVLALLVHLGWFKTIQMSFLIVGHTHEDVDQMFSLFVMGMKFDPVYSLPNFRKLVEKWYPSIRPEILLLTSILDVKTWFKESHCLLDLKGYSQPHAILLEKNEDGVVQLQFKDYCSSDETWKGGVDVFHHLPQGQPPLCKPSPLAEEVLTKFRKNMQFIPLCEQDWLLSAFSDQGAMKDEEICQNIFDLSSPNLQNDYSTPSSIIATTTTTTTTSNITSRITSQHEMTSQHLVIGGYIFIRENNNSKELLLGRIKLVNPDSVSVNVAQITTKGEDLLVHFHSSDESSFLLSAVEHKSVQLTKKSKIKVKYIKEIKNRGLSIKISECPPSTPRTSNVATYWRSDHDTFPPPENAAIYRSPLNECSPQKIYPPLSQNAATYWPFPPGPSLRSRTTNDVESQRSILSSYPAWTAPHPELYYPNQGHI
eukprot:TRINITY_DN192_c0_g1_i13.p1 TRINITY_DN192_c0_g1~~TRINITY_DN192_c0_g1_i13.p1  ORF type:complete len:858 (-),score=130.06 TRINITY_DN192_c0_g1_i13:38-2350(-)